MLDDVVTKYLLNIPDDFIKRICCVFQSYDVVRVIPTPDIISTLPVRKFKNNKSSLFVALAYKS